MAMQVKFQDVDNPFAKYASAAELASTQFQARHPSTRIYYDRFASGPIFRFSLELQDGSLYSIKLKAREAAGLTDQQLALRICVEAERFVARGVSLSL